MASQIQIETIGRRHYLMGHTYPIRDSLRAAGCHWDAQRRAWWTAKREVAERLAKRGSATDTLDPARPDIIGRAEYKGHQYLLLWEGLTKRGTRAAKLAFRDGSRTFWADAAEYRVTKIYPSPLSLRSLNQLAEEYREQREEAEERARREELARRPTPEQLIAQRMARLMAIDEIVAQASRKRAEGVTTPIAFSRHAKGGVRVGEIVHHGGQPHVVVAVGEPYYHSADECEEMDCFCGHHGWQTPYDAIPVEPSAEELAEQAAEAAKQQAVAAEAAAYEAAIAAIPADYQRREGTFLPQQCMDWQCIAHNDERVLFRAALPDGRFIYRQDFHTYSDHRLTLWMPPDVCREHMREEIAQLGITPEAAREWLERYRGCVGTELYEFAAQEAV